MNRRLIVHLSRTPLAGAPGRLSDALDRHSCYSSICFIEADYKDAQAGIFGGGAVYLKTTAGLEDRLLDEALRGAAIIHIHNQISPSLAARIREMDLGIPVVYHLHSPTREGPLYAPRSGDMQQRITAILTAAQAHPRFYPNAIPVPNIVPELPPTPFPPSDDRIRILYAPVQKRGGRWNGKGSLELDAAIDEVSRRPDVEIVRLGAPCPSHVLYRFRQACHITIDEISTGAFHQISLEGLHAGNAVINGADFATMQTIAGWAGEHPPFIISSERSIRDDLNLLLNDREHLSRIQKASHEYAIQRLNPKNLVSIYERVYNDM